MSDYPDFPYIKVLNHGFVGLVDVMGDDSSIVQAARVSYGKGTKTTREDAGLINYLLRHRHTTPFEMVEFKFVARMPIFVARQWVRHRTASLNEYSGRYSEMPDMFWVPEIGAIANQSKTNKQGRSLGDINRMVNEATSGTYPAIDWATVAESASYFDTPTEKAWARRECILSALDPELHAELKDIRTSIDAQNKSARAMYETLLSKGTAREIARTVLPLTQYTEWYWKMDLHNLMHFLRLRLDTHAQGEMRAFAEAIEVFVREHVPLTWEVFLDMQGGAFLTSQEKEAILEFIYNSDLARNGECSADEIACSLKARGFTDRRVNEFNEKMGL